MSVNKISRVVLISHGTIAKGVCDAVEMIFGIADNLTYVCLDKNMSSDDFINAFGREVTRVSPFKSLCVIADLQGGSPYTNAATYINEHNIANAVLLSGLNLTMALAAIEAGDVCESGKVNEIIEAGRDAVQVFLLNGANGANDSEDEL